MYNNKSFLNTFQRNLQSKSSKTELNILSLHVNAWENIFMEALNQLYRVGSTNSRKLVSCVQLKEAALVYFQKNVCMLHACSFLQGIQVIVFFPVSPWLFVFLMLNFFYNL